MSGRATAEGRRPVSNQANLNAFMKALLAPLLLITAACSPGAPPLPPPPGSGAGGSAGSEVTIPPRDIVDNPFPYPLPIAAAEEILRETDLFDMAHDGPRPSRQVQAFNVGIGQNDALSRLRALGRNRRPVPRLYALCGLLLLARQEGVGMAYSLSLVSGEVAVRQADSIFETPVPRAIVLIFADDVPRRLRAQRAAADAVFREPR
jgi:hypothetical protein